MQIAVVVVILTVTSEGLRVLLIRRGGAPFIGWWALPGGQLLPSESLSNAASRKLGEETGVDDVYLEQLFTFDDLDAEGTEAGIGSSVTTAYFALVDTNRVRLRAAPA